MKFKGKEKAHRNSGEVIQSGFKTSKIIGPMREESYIALVLNVC
jgi:hypothetical protein